MKINKTVDECIIEQKIALLQFLVDNNLTEEQKQETTYWLINFLNLQDAIKKESKEEIDSSIEALNKIFSPIYYQNAYQEFVNANLVFNQIKSLEKLNSIIKNIVTKEKIIEINHFSKIIIKTIKKYQENINDSSEILNQKYFSDLKLLMFIIYYNITYLFKNDLDKTIVSPLLKILSEKIQENKEKKHKITLLDLMIKENEVFFKKCQIINLINFIHGLNDIFDSETNIIKKSKLLIYRGPKEVEITFNQLMKQKNFNLYDEFLIKQKNKHIKNNVLMHLFAYETYFIQGNNNHEIYQKLILDKILVNNPEFLTVFQEYKKINNIDKKI